MAAIISVVQNWGSYAGGNEVAKTIFYFLPIQSGIASKNNNPMLIPASGTKYSYEIWLRFRCDYPPSIKCDNFKVWYDSGMPSSGYKITVNDPSISQYSEPTNTKSTKGNRVDFTTKDSSDKITVNGTLVNVGDYTEWLVFQLEVYSDAIADDYSVIAYYQYDEQ